MGKASKSGQKSPKAKGEKHNQDSEEAEEMDFSTCFLCAEPSEGKVCSDCSSTAYCSEEHLKLHRPEKFCFPFKVDQKEGVGRCLVATRDIQPMELILYDRTLAYGPKASVEPACLQCLKTLKNQVKKFRCTSCGWPLCDEKCQSGKVHQMECKILSKCSKKPDFSDLSSPHPAYRAIAPLRLLLLKEAQPEFHARFKWLMDHNEERRDGDRELWNLHRDTVNKFIREDCGAFFTDAEIDRAVGLFWTNAFSMSSGVGQAVFPTFSFVSHSCVSNSNHVVFPNRHLALQAKVFIPKGDELTISYISPIQSTLRRHIKLQDKWFFECHCPRCSDPTEKASNVSSLICQAAALHAQTGAKKSARCGGTMTLRDPFANMDDKYWGCLDCGNKLEAKDVLNLENDIARDLQSMAEEKKTQLDRFREMYDQFKVFLHRNHYLLLLLKRHIIVLNSDDLATQEMEQVEDIKKMCEEVLEVLNIIDPGCTRDRGVVLRHLSEATKIVYRKMFQSGSISHDIFTRRVHECMILFEESQRCMSMLVKKDSA